MNLDEAQKQKVSGWISEGLKLSEIQSRLASELGIRMTYMEARFLMDDLKLNPKNTEAPPPPALPPSQPPSSGHPGESKGVAAPGPLLADADNLPPQTGGKVSVTVDQLARPGALVSGKVTFSDGNSAEWYLDQMGRLGLAPQQQGYRPSQTDLMTFQTQLQNQLAQMGF
jgi:hypothetical protein